MEHSHHPRDIAKRLESKPKQSYLRDWVYGGIDGAVTTFAVVSGVIGAALATHVIIILGIANLVADGFSMAAANFLGTRAEEDEYKYIEAFETRQVERVPEGEKEEVRQIYIKKGFSGDVLEGIVTTITSDKQLWVDTMMQEEYGLAAAIRSPIKAAISTFVAFLVCGVVPLITFVFHLPHPFLFACLSTGVVFFIIGSLKSRWSIQPWWRSGLTTLLVGGAAAAIAYFIGTLFHGYR